MFLNPNRQPLLRPLQFSDFVVIVNRKGSLLFNPVFGKISDTLSLAPGQRSSGGTVSLAHVGDSEDPASETVPQGEKEPSQLVDGEQTSPTPQVQLSEIDQGPSHWKNQCLYCSRNRTLEDQSLRWKPYQERIKFLLCKKLCFGCLSTEHVPKLCPQRKKLQG